MIIKLDMNSDTAIYEQLYNSIVRGIATGQLKPGEKMPTVRKLGVDLGINLHTVNKAYAILKQNGYLSSHRNKGAVVNEQRFYPADDNFVKDIKDSLAPMVCECYARGMEEKDVNKLVAEILSDIKNERSDD